MRALELLLYLFCIAGALGGYFFLDPPLSWIAITCCALFAVWTLFVADEPATLPVENHNLVPERTLGIDSCDVFDSGIKIGKVGGNVRDHGY